MSENAADFRILGPLEVRLGDRVLPLGPPKQRALLALLLVHANQTLSTDRLIDSLWGRAAPPDARRALQYHVSRLRASLRQGGDELAVQLVTQPPGYRFEVDEARIDALRFADAVRRARRLIELRPADAAKLLADALGEWRGPALADVEYADFAQSEVRRLDALRTGAVVDRIGADLADGGGAELIGEIEALLGDQSSNEQLWAHLMLALYRAGRTREALDGFQRARGELGAAGLSPSKPLVDLESRIVADDPALNASPVATQREASPVLPAALELLADEATFVGRVGERAVLGERWRRASGGHTTCALVTGEAGIGKSRLVAELAAEVRVGGGRVLFGACFEDVDHPYAPFVQAIAADAAGLDASDVRRRAGEGRVALAWLSGELAESLDVARDETAGAPSDRGVMLDGVAGWFAASESPTLLIIEDLHWATATTRDALRRLIEMCDRAPLLVVATARDTPPDLDPGLAGLLGDLERLPNVEALRVRGLDHDEVAKLVGNDQTADVARIVAETGGSPLLVSHVAGGDDRPGWTLEALLARRDRLLDDAARTLVDLAATFGAEFDADLLAAAQGVTLLAVLESLESADAAGLVVPQPGRPRRFAFVHALFRTHRYQALPLRQRLELHARAASALAGRADDRFLSEWARHACLAVPVGDAAVAVDLARRAGEVAEHAYALDEAAAHYRRGLDAAAALDPSDRAVERELRIRLGAALHHSADRTGLDMLVDAADEARRDGDGNALVQAALGIPQVGGNFGQYLEPHRILAITEHALSACTDEPTRALLTIDLATQLLFTNRADEGFQLARDAEAMARRNGDPRLLGRVLAKATGRNVYPTDTDEGERVAAELVTLGEQLDRVDLTLAGLLAQASLALAAGDLVRWRGLTDRIASTLGDRSLPYVQTRALIYRTVDAFLDGDLDRAMNLVRTIGQLVQRMGQPGALAQSMRVTVRRMQARDDDIRPRLERSAALPGDPLLHRSFLAAACAREGAIDEARRVLASLRDDGWPFPKTYTASVAACELAEAAEVADDPDAAQRAIVVCTPFAGGIASAYALVVAPFDQALAQASLGAGDAEATTSCPRVMRRVRSATCCARRKT